MYRKTKITLIVFFAGILTLVSLRVVYPYFSISGSLVGATEEVPAPIWNWSTIKSGEAFRATEKWYSENVGFRNFWVRLDNQLTYHVFDEAPQQSGGTTVVVGKNDWLYERQYVKKSVTPPKLDDQRVDSAITHMLSVQHKLERRGIPFLLIIAPSKAEVYPERVPTHFLGGRDKEQITTFYEHYRSTLVEAGINVYDTAQLFRDMRKKGERDLFSRGGTHWSYFAALKVLNETRGILNPKMKRKMPPLEVREIIQAPAKAFDTDLLRLLNLLGDFEANHDQPYPQMIAQTAVPSDQLPKILWVNDSFGWPLIELLYGANAAQPSESLYYNATLHKIPGAIKTEQSLEDVELESFIQTYDAVVMVWTEIAFEYFGWGFFEHMDRRLD